MTNPTEIGVVVLSLSVVMVALKLVEHFVLQRRRNGSNGKFALLECPNKIHGIAENLRGIGSSLKLITRDSVDTLAGVEHLVEQHKSVDGEEQWKFTPALRQDIAGAFRRLGELLTLQRQQMTATERMVALTTETLSRVDVMQERQISALKKVTELQKEILAQVLERNRK